MDRDSCGVSHLGNFTWNTCTGNNKNNSNHTDRRNLRFLQSPHCAANCLQQARSSGPGTIMCKSHATHRVLITCNMPCGTWYKQTAQLYSDRIEIAFILALFYWLKSLTDEGGEETGVPGEKARRRSSENTTY